MLLSKDSSVVSLFYRPREKRDFSARVVVIET